MQLLGAVLAILSAATFALTNATGRRGVISGTPAQGMVISMPVGLACFLAFAVLTGAIQHLGRFSGTGTCVTLAAGVLHFVLGRYCNFRASQAAGREPDGARDPAQLGGHARLGRRHSPRTLHDAAGRGCRADGLGVACYPAILRAPAASKLDEPAFKPRVAAGFFFALDRGACVRQVRPSSFARHSKTSGR